VILPYGLNVTRPSSHSGRETVLSELISQALEDQRVDEFRSSTSLDALYQRADRETFDAALKLIASDRAEERMLGVRILRDFGDTGKPDYERAFWRESLPALIALMGREEEVAVMRWLVSGIGFFGRPEALLPLVGMVSYPDADVRYSVASAITASVTEWAEPEPEAISALSKLASDPDPAVRYSAVFDLAHRGPDSPAVRSVLCLAVNDADNQVAAYARGGLGRLDGRSLEECPERELIDDLL
jgi:HEAT repeat protein